METLVDVYFLAAGFGERLKPITAIYPKPFVPLLGVPILQRSLEEVSTQLKIDKILIATHTNIDKVHEWKRVFIEEGINQFQNKIHILEESEQLNSGGSIANGRKLLDKTFIVMNGDTLCDIDWDKFYNYHKNSGNLVTLAVQDNNYDRCIGADQKNQLCKIIKNKTDQLKENSWFSWYTFTGIAIYEKEFLSILPKEGEKFSILPFWRKLIEESSEDKKIGVYDIGKDTYWIDVGTPNNFLQATVDHLLGENRRIHHTVKVPHSLQTNGVIVAEKNCVIGDNVTLENVVVLPFTKIPNDAQYCNAILGPNFAIQSLNWPEKINPRKSLHNRIGKGASDRVYFKINSDVVLLVYSAYERNIKRQIELTNLFCKYSINVPKILQHKPLIRQLELENLGDLTFNSWLKNNVENKTKIKTMIYRIFDQLFQIHTIPTEGNIYDKDLFTEFIFDEKILRWETDYFLEQFVKRICKVNMDFTDLISEFEKLAKEVNQIPKRIMHRDFQSENVMITNEYPWLIDFQAAYLGPPFYDVVSFLQDPYSNFSMDFRAEFETFYLQKLATELTMNEDRCKRAYLLCGIQRHLCILGGFSFITHIRGKVNFFLFVRPTLNFLSHELASCDDFPILSGLIKNILALPLFNNCDQ